MSRNTKRTPEVQQAANTHPRQESDTRRRSLRPLILFGALIAGAVVGDVTGVTDGPFTRRRTRDTVPAAFPPEQEVTNLTEKYKDYPTSILIRGEDGEVIEKIDGKGLLLNVTPVNFPDVKGLPTHKEVAEMRADQNYPHFVEKTTQYVYKIDDGKFRYFEVPIYGTSIQTADGGTEYGGSPFELCERDLSFCAGFGVAPSNDSDAVQSLIYTDANRAFAIHLIEKED
ncbi:hypothetical protein KBD20_00530 [Candidatus Saccharibacteria bacterium]|nr:hypothetical protein [Candidatus Saccharibacteria bacterium]